MATATMINMPVMTLVNIPDAILSGMPIAAPICTNIHDPCLRILKSSIQQTMGKIPIP